jgi:hypothetical protein
VMVMCLSNQVLNEFHSMFTRATVSCAAVLELDTGFV